MIPAPQAKAWAAQFAYPSQFVEPVFAPGPGTPWPLPSMPIAQAARYWFAVQKWSLYWSLDVDFDSGDDEEKPIHTERDNIWVPYGCGGKADGSYYDRDYVSTWLRPPASLYPAPYGDKQAAPSLRERYRPQEASLYAGILNAFDSTNYAVGFGELAGFFFPPAPLINGSATALAQASVVFDPAVPGNVYLGFVAGVGSLISCPDVAFGVGSTPYPSGVDLIVDGMAVPLYQADPDYEVTGTASLDTSTEPM